MIKKTVTPRKIAANQNNGKKSTGPRTPWGKMNSRFNAVKTGSFAEEVVIPDVDGDDACRSFETFLQQLQEELQPVGALETAMVEKVAEGLWRLRRATRAECGSARVGGFWDRCYDPPEDSFIYRHLHSVDAERAWIKILTAAKDEIARTGNLPRQTFEKIRPVLEPQQPNANATTDNQETSEPAIDDDFVRRLEKKIESLNYAVLQVDLRLANRNSDLIKQSGLAPVEESEKISRYRIRTQKEVDWALRTLFVLQKRRRRSNRRSS